MDTERDMSMYPGFAYDLIVPKKVKALLDEYVIGQEEAKKALASLSWNIQLLKKGLSVPRVNLLYDSNSFDKKP